MESSSFKNGWIILFKYLFEYKKDIFFLSVVGVISAIANGTVPFIIGNFFDAVLNSSEVFLGTKISIPKWLFLIIIFGLVQIVADVVDWINSKERKRLGLKLFSLYKSKASFYLLKLPLGFHHKNKMGEVQDKINRATESLSRIVEQVIINLAPQFLSIIIGFAISFWISWQLGIVLVCGVVLYLVTMRSIVGPIGEITKRGHQSWNRFYGICYESISNISVVKKFTAEDHERRKIYNYVMNVASPLWYKAEIIWSNISFFQSIIITLTRVTVFVLSVFLIKSGDITIGGLIALNGYAGMVFGPFVALAFNWQFIQNGVISLDIADKILKIPTEDYTPKNHIKLKEINGNIEFKNVTFHYNKKDGDVLKDVNLKVNAGEVVALVGESGVGKSTLIELISAYYFVQKGEVLVDNVNVKKLDLNFLRRNIAVVPQEVVLFNDTIENNIKYGNFKATREEIGKAVKDAHADEFIDNFPKKYKQLVGERGVKLSVGQKQRIGIARAVLRDPKILILDEPTSALDSVTEKYVTESLRKLMEGRTTFIVAHRLSTVREADKIVVFEKGSIVEIGNHDDLMKIENGTYRHLYELHIGLK